MSDRDVLFVLGFGSFLQITLCLHLEHHVYLFWALCDIVLKV